MTDFVIEKGIPFPPENHRAGNSRSRRPVPCKWDRLEVGDSSPEHTEREAKIAQQWARRRGRHFQIEKQSDGSGWRVWRRT